MKGGDEDGVEMSDQQHAGSGPLTLGDEMAGAIERCSVNPARREAERVELPAKDVADRAHAGEVHRAAIDVDDALEQRERLRVASIDGGGERLFLGGHASSSCRRLPRRRTRTCRQFGEPLHGVENDFRGLDVKGTRDLVGRVSGLVIVRMILDAEIEKRHVRAVERAMI